MTLREALPSYEIGDELGRGGWGVVLAGRHRQLDRQVAIKQVNPTFAVEPAVRRRFVEEGRVLASVDHPHVVPVYDFVERDGLCVLVMEYLPGGTLRARMRRGRMPAARAVALTVACTAGIDAAHRRGVLHRDVKPENMMFAASGAIKVTDFGLAKVVGGSLTLATRAGDVLGTPAYIAPEQARGEQLTPATDVYALATMLYEMLSGTLPFPGGANAMALLFQHAFEAPVPLGDTAPSVPPELASVVMRGLATDPEDRFDSAESFGLAVTVAAGRAWGPGWLAAEPVPVMGAGAMIASERLSWSGWSGRASVPPAPDQDVTLLPEHPSGPPADDTALPPSLQAISLSTPPPDPQGATVVVPGPPAADPAEPTVAVPRAAAPEPSDRTLAIPRAAPGPDPAPPPVARRPLLVGFAWTVGIALAVLLLVLFGPSLLTGYSS